jgi:PAS domain-containing protein
MVLMVILRTRDYWDDQGKPSRFIGSMLDVTDLKKSRRRIQECEKKMEA